MRRKDEIRRLSDKYFDKSGEIDYKKTGLNDRLKSAVKGDLPLAPRGAMHKLSGGAAEGLAA